MGKEAFHDFRRKTRYLFSLLMTEFLQEMRTEQRNVIFPLAQGRDKDGDDVEPIKEVFTERPFPHPLRQILIGCSNHPDIHF